MMTWGRGFSLPKATDVEIVLMHKVVRNHKRHSQVVLSRIVACIETPLISFVGQATFL